MILSVFALFLLHYHIPPEAVDIVCQYQYTFLATAEALLSEYLSHHLIFGGYRTHCLVIDFVISRTCWLAPV